MNFERIRHLNRLSVGSPNDRDGENCDSNNA